MEEWRPVPRWEGLYEVSDQGRVRSLRRKGLILKPSLSNSGHYPLYLLYINGKAKGRYGHHLVAEAFIGPRPDGMEVRHLDGDPANCTLTNLAYGTSGENKRDQVRHGTHPEARRTHRDAGHEYTEANIYIRRGPDGSFKGRSCRKCHNEETQARWRKKLADAVPYTKDDCEKPQIAKGLCSGHYQQQWKASKSA